MSLEVRSILVRVRMEDGVCATATYTVIESAGFVVALFESRSGAAVGTLHPAWDHIPFQAYPPRLHPPHGDSR